MDAVDYEEDYDYDAPAGKGKYGKESPTPVPTPAPTEAPTQSAPAWTGWVNSYDREVNWVGGNGYVMTGIHSHHHNSYEDRLWDFQSSNMLPVRLQCCRTGLIIGMGSSRGETIRKFSSVCIPSTTMAR